MLPNVLEYLIKEDKQFNLNQLLPPLMMTIPIKAKKVVVIRN
jgi:hypothetical protein